MYKHEPVGRGFIHYHINHKRVYELCVINQGAIMHQGFTNGKSYGFWELLLQQPTCLEKNFISCILDRSFPLQF